jgi:hypothetical protein
VDAFEVRLNRDPLVIADRLWVKVDFLPESGGMRSEYHAAARIVTASMLARASAGVR